MRRAGVPFRFTTNTTRRPRSALTERLASMGIAARAEEILSAPAAAADWLRYRPQDEDRARVTADTGAVLDSIAGLPDWLGI